MSTDTKHWYQDGNTVSGIAVVVVVLYFAFPFIKNYLPNEKREKAITLYNNHLKVIKEMTEMKEDIGLKAILQHLDTIDPYSPVGVDPRLSEAVVQLKSALKESGTYYYVNKTHDPYLFQRSKDAVANVDKVMNEIASEVGGIK